MADKPVVVYKCDCCGRVAAELRDGALVLYQRHDGEQHITVIILPAQPERPTPKAGGQPT